MYDADRTLVFTEETHRGSVNECTCPQSLPFGPTEYAFRLTRLTNLLISGIERSLGLLEERAPDENLACYGLVTDSDLRTVMGCVLTEAGVANMEPVQRFFPAEWIEFYQPFDHANAELSEIADKHYARESDDVGPDDDHLRPWKAELYESLVEALRNRKEWGTFDTNVFLIATSHDPNDWLFERVSKSTKELNSPKLYKAWKKAWSGT